jgi:hypothetical protein
MAGEVEIRPTDATRETGAWLVEASERARDLRPVWATFRAYMARVTHDTFDALGKGGGTYRGVTWAPFADQYTRKTDGVVVPAWGGVPRLRFGISTRTLKGGRKKFGVAQQLIGNELGAQDRTTRAFVPTRAIGGRYVPARELVETPTGTVSRIVRQAYTGLDRYKSGPNRGELKEPNVRGKLRPSGTRIDESSLLLQDTGRLRAGATSNAREYLRRLVIYVPQSIGYAMSQWVRRKFLFFTPADGDYVANEAAKHIMGRSS